MMCNMMMFPNTWEEFEKVYGFEDTEEIYTNKSRLIPSFRVKQWLEHESALQWVSCKEKLPDKGLRVLMQLNNAWQIVGWYDIEDAQWFELIYAEPVANDRVLAWMPLPPSYRGDNE